MVQGNITVAFCVLSYAGQLNVSILADADAIPDLTAFAEGTADALTQLGAGKRSWLNLADEPYPRIGLTQGHENRSPRTSRR